MLRSTFELTQPRWTELATETRSALVRSEIYRILVWGFLNPLDAFMDDLRASAAALHDRAADLPTHSATLAALDRLSQSGGLPPHDVADEYAAVFSHTISAECPHYETQYAAGIIFAQAQRLSDIAAFYRAFGMDVSADARERPDHIATELEFLSVLAFREAVAVIENDAEHVEVVRDAERTFLIDHLATWGFSFTERLARKARRVAPPHGGFFAALAACLDGLLRDELASMNFDPAAITPVEPVAADFEPDGCCFACGPAGEPALANLPGFEA